MKISKKMQEMINNQINRELYSAYLYLAMAAHFESANFKGFANWMKKQAHEESTHALKFFDYVHERGGSVALSAVDAPPARWNSPLEIFEQAYQHELQVTVWIHELYAGAADEKDFATQSILKWFIDEQVEEEASAEEIVQKLKMAGDNKGALLMIDRELMQRK